MTKQEIAALICKTLALYIVSDSAINSVTTAFPYLYQQSLNMMHDIPPSPPFSNTPAIFLSEITALLLPIAITIFLWKKADWLSRHMVGNEEEKHTETKITGVQVQTLIVSAIGLFIVVQSLPQLIYYATSLLLWSYFHTEKVPFTLLELMNPFFEVLVGGSVLFNGSKIANFLHRNTKPAKEIAPNPPDHQ